MERKTTIHAEEGKQEIVITREFDLPVQLLFRAYDEAPLFEQWMGTKVLKWENHKHGSYVFETMRDNKAVFRANGTIHEIVRNEHITRTFEMENSPLPVQLEFLTFEKIGDQRSRLVMQIVFKSADHRDQLLMMPFAQGINMAHNRLQDMLTNLIKQTQVK